MNWSLSKLGTFTKCRRRFLHAYIQKLPGKQSYSAGRGVDKHQAIEDYFKAGKTLPDDLSKYREWFDVLRSHDHYSENQLAMLKDWLPCSWDDPNVWWKGVLDLKVLSGHRAWLFDWKTGKVYPDHDDQKELYSIAIFVAHPEVMEIEAWHIYLDLKNKDSKKPYTRDMLPALITKWNAKLAPYAQALEKYTPETVDIYFMANPTYLCDWCPYSKGAGGPCQFG